jgi:mannose/fructose/N-acetylgalactosamine-specific phosphotransferase system component IIB
MVEFMCKVSKDTKNPDKKRLVLLPKNKDVYDWVQVGELIKCVSTGEVEKGRSRLSPNERAKRLIEKLDKETIEILKKSL